MPWKFRATLYRPPGTGTWTLVPLPASVIRAGGLKMRVRLKGTIDGAPFGGAILSAGGSDLFVVVAAPIRASIGKQAGDAVDIVVERDEAPPSVPVPADLAAALRADPMARAGFEGFAPSHRKQYVQWIEGAVKPETRKRRIDGTLEGARKRRPMK